ncbi:MAG: zinc-binding dehydrogenase [Christensenellales bacterium]
MEQAVAADGKIVQVGISPGTSPITSSRLQKNGSAYYGTIGSSGHGIWSNVIRLIAFGKIHMDRMVDSTFSLDDAIEAIKYSKSAAGKVVVTPNEF